MKQLISALTRKGLLDPYWCMAFVPTQATADELFAQWVQIAAQMGGTVRMHCATTPTGSIACIPMEGI